MYTFDELLWTPPILLSVCMATWVVPARPSATARRWRRVCWTLFAAQALGAIASGMLVTTFAPEAVARWHFDRGLGGVCSLYGLIFGALVAATSHFLKLPFWRVGEAPQVARGVGAYRSAMIETTSARASTLGGRMISGFAMVAILGSCGPNSCVCAYVKDWPPALQSTPRLSWKLAQESCGVLSGCDRFEVEHELVRPRRSLEPMTRIFTSERTRVGRDQPGLCDLLEAVVSKHPDDHLRNTHPACWRPRADLEDWNRAQDEYLARHGHGPEVDLTALPSSPPGNPGTDAGFR